MRFVKGIRRLTITLANVAVIAFSLVSCLIGAGTHGHFETFELPYSQHEIVSIVDQFLISNPEPQEYSIDDDFGWIKIRIPLENKRFSFAIDSGAVTLITAGDTLRTAFSSDYSSDQKKDYIKSFKSNVVDRLTFEPKPLKIVSDPLRLSINERTGRTTHHIIVRDTTLAYPLPEGIDSTNIDYFQNLIVATGRRAGRTIRVNQYCNAFEVEGAYTGHVSDSIYVTRFYRRMGSPFISSTLFDSEAWKSYLKETTIEERKTDFERLRKAKTKAGYTATEVFSPFSKQYWMEGYPQLKCHGIAN